MLSNLHLLFTQERLSVARFVVLDIQWKGKIGYGDIVSPICYAHNLSFKLNTKVQLTFRWDYDPLQKIHISDPETLWERASFLFTHATKQKTDVTLIHKFSNSLDINHTNYVWSEVADDPFHNFWVSSIKRHWHNGLIVVNSTTNNVLTLKQYGKSWKDPVSDNWPDLVAALSKKARVVIVDYRTPIRELCSILREATCFIGYHGTAAWVAKYLQVPSILYSQGNALTENSFLSSVILNQYENAAVLTDNLEEYIAVARSKIKDHRNFYKQYTPGVKLLRSLRHEI